MQLPIEEKSYIKRLAIVYFKLYENKYGIRPTPNFSQLGKVLKNLIEFYDEYQIAYFLIQFFECAGMDENDIRWLESKTHNILFLTNKVDIIRAHSKNILKIDSDDIEIIKPIVDKIII